jgi:hypothetical protein
MMHPTIGVTVKSESCKTLNGNLMTQLTSIKSSCAAGIQLLDVVKEWVTDDAEKIKYEVVFVKCN